MLATMRVLLTGMSGTGKSTLVLELRRRGYLAFDADDDGFSVPAGDGRWSWRRDAIAALLDQTPAGEPLFFAGCDEAQAELPFERRVLLTAPRAVLLERLRTRTSNPYGNAAAQRRQVLGDLAGIEPLLRRSAGLVLTTTTAPAALADELLAWAGLSARRPRPAS